MAANYTPDPVLETLKKLKSQHDKMVYEKEQLNDKREMKKIKKNKEIQ